MDFTNRAGNGDTGSGNGGGGGGGGGDEPTPPTPPRLPLLPPPTSSLSGSRIQPPRPPSPPADKDAGRYSAGTSNGGGVVPPTPPGLPISPPSTSPSRYPSTLPTSPPPFQPPRPPARPADRDTDEGSNNFDLMEEENDDVDYDKENRQKKDRQAEVIKRFYEVEREKTYSLNPEDIYDERPDDNYMPEEKDGVRNWDQTEAEYNRGHLEESKPEVFARQNQGENHRGPSDCKSACLRRRLGGMQDRQVHYVYSKENRQKKDRQAEVIKRFYEVEQEETYSLNPEDIYDERPDDNYMPEEKDGVRNWDQTEAEYNHGHLEESKPEVVARQDQGENHRGPSDCKSACLRRSLGGMQDRQMHYVYSKIDQGEAKAVRVLVEKIVSFTGYYQLEVALDASLAPVNLDLVTVQSSFQEILGRPLEQTVDDTCAIVASAKCVEVQHRREYEALYGAGTFGCNAAAPRKLRKACLHNKIWSHKDGAEVGDVLKMIQTLGGVRTTDERRPAPSFLPVRSWQVHAWDSGAGLSADRVAELLDARGPFIGTIWASPWYHLFDRAQDNDMVYQSGCARDSALQEVSKASFGELVGHHSVVCFEYRVCNGNLHVLIQDNHNRTTGPERWIHYFELEWVYTVSVNTMDRFHN